MRVLVTGGAGFIGSHTVDRLLAQGHDVTVLDALTPPVHRDGVPAYLSPEVDFYLGDVRNRELMTNLLRRADAVYHFAAYQDYLTDFARFSDVNVVYCPHLRDRGGRAPRPGPGSRGLLAGSNGGGPLSCQYTANRYPACGLRCNLRRGIGTSPARRVAARSRCKRRQSVCLTPRTLTGCPSSARKWWP
jgi:hypothetical protein